MGKAFEKQTKTIEDQGKKQVKAIQDNKQLVNINKDDDYKDIIVKINYYFQEKEKSLKIFTIKGLIK